MNRPFLNIAHRGARAFAPENTLPAIRAAQRLGANVVELDVQMSRDGELVLFHDDTVLRCSDGRHRFPSHADYHVSAFTWDELSVLDVGTWYVHELAMPASQRQPYLRDLRSEEIETWITAGDADEYGSGRIRIPRLRDALMVARECQLAVVLDLKAIPRRDPALGRATLEVVRDLAMGEDTLISSFDHTLLAELRELDNTIGIAVLTDERLYRVREYLDTVDADALHPGWAKALDEMDRALAHELSGAGYWVNVWTVNDPPAMRALIDARVTGIFTDYPNRLAEVVRDTREGTPTRPRFRRHGPAEAGRKIAQ